MKRFIRLVCFVLVMTVCLATPAAAAEEVSTWSSSFFTCHSAYLWKVSDSEFRVWFDVTAVKGMEELGASVIKVQRSTDNENWTTMSTYKKAVYPQMVAYNTGNHCSYVTYYGTSGYYYRALVTFYAKNSSGTGEYYYYTSSIQL